jgi:predicted alpha/beta-fold hydrolase
VLRHTSFGSLEAYLDGYSIAGAALRGLRVPATILTAADDPVIPIGDFHSLELPPQVELDVAAHGGHCGFLESTSLRRFTGDYIAARMRWHLAGDAAAARKD